MGNIAHFFIGIAMAAGSALFNIGKAALNPINTVLDFFKSLGGELLGASSEFFGDGAQGFLRELSQKIIDGKACKKIRSILDASRENGEEYKELCEQIFRELQGLSDEDLAQHSKNEKRAERRELKQNAKAVAELSIEILFNYDFTALLSEKSPVFAQLKKQNSPYAAAISEMIGEAVKAYNEYRFRRIDESEFKLASAVIVSSLKDYIKDANEEMLRTMLSFIANQNNGVISLQEVALSRYIPKYILKACPVCGYMGDRLYTDETTNTTHCAACGASYSVLEYCEPDLYAEISKKVELITQDTSAISDRAVAIGEDVSVIRQVCADNQINLQKMSRELKEGLQQVMTGEYLERCFSKQIDDYSVSAKEHCTDMKKFVGKAFQTFCKKILDHIDKLKKEGEGVSQAALLDWINQMTEDNRKYNEYLGQKIANIEKQISRINNYALEQFDGLKDQGRKILQYVDNLCTKELLNEKADALGADIRKVIALSDASQSAVGELNALTTAGIAQILSAIDSLRESHPPVETENDNNWEGLEEAVRNENARLSSQIVGLSDLVAQGNAENRSNFRTIIKMQEETKAILMANVGMMDPKDFSKLYRGRLPSRLLYHDGLGGPFPCPYCGAEEDRRINNDDYCQCSVCGNKFLGVNPMFHDYDPALEGEKDIWELLAKKYGRDAEDSLLATPDNVWKWREQHTPEISENNRTLNFHAGFQRLIFLPQKIITDDQKYDFTNLRDIETLIIPSDVEEFGERFLLRFQWLKKIVFLGDNEGRRSFRSSLIYVNKSVAIYGKNCTGHDIYYQIVKGRGGRG